MSILPIARVTLLEAVRSRLAWLVGAPSVSYVLIAGLLVAAGLEAVFAVCLGCIVYRLIWECEDCNDISERLRVAMAAQRDLAPR